MAEYGPNLYGDELTFYGARPASDLSANPMVAKVFTHGTVDLTWPYPKMAVDSFRIVRNQTGHPTHETDGVVLLHQDTLPEGSSSRGLIDGVEHPLDVGRYAYYSAFAKLAGAWRRVGKTQVLIPGRPTKSLINRGTLEDPIFLDNSFALQTVLLDLIPRVFTNARRDSVGPHDETSALREFLTALALAPEEIRTIADLLLPTASKANLPPGLLKPTFLQRGLTDESGIPVIDQKRLLREAYNVSSRRGTAIGLTNYVESLTGWAPEVASTGNILRYSKSSTFSGTAGEWGAATTGQGAVTLTPVSCAGWAPVVGDPNYALTTAGKVVGTGGRLELPAGGWITPNSPGFFPVSPNTTYTFSAYFRPTDLSTNPIAKTVNMMARGYQRATDVGHSKAWPDRSLQDYVFGDGEWRIDDPFFWPRTVNASFTLGTGTVTSQPGADANGWQRKTMTLSTGPSINFLSFAIEWTGVSSDNWLITGVSLNEASTAGDYRYPNSAIVTVSPTRTNLVTNPSFPAGSTTGWSYSGDAVKASSTDVPDGVLVSNSLSFQCPSMWLLGTELAEIVTPTERAFTASAYVRGPVGESITLGLDTPTLDASESTITFTPDPVSIDTATIDGGVLFVSTGTEHNFEVGQSVIISGQPLINGTVTVARVLSATVFSVTTALPNATLDPADCANALATATVAPWRRISTTLTLPIGTHTPSLYLKSATTGTFKIAGVLAEQGAVTVGDYFDGDSPGQYGTEWRGTAHESVSDMYRNKVLMTVRLSDTLDEYVPRNVGCQIVTLAGTLVASQAASA